MTDDLRHDLARAADAYAIPPGDLRGVIRRGQQRVRRQRRASAVLAAVAVVAGSLGVSRIAGRDDPAALCQWSSRRPRRRGRRPVIGARAAERLTGAAGRGRAPAALRWSTPSRCRRS